MHAIFTSLSLSLLIACPFEKGGTLQGCLLSVENCPATFLPVPLSFLLTWFPVGAHPVLAGFAYPAAPWYLYPYFEIAALAVCLVASASPAASPAAYFAACYFLVAVAVAALFPQSF